jgi:hypothetical protein
MWEYPECEGEDNCEICVVNKVIEGTDWCFACRERCEEENTHHSAPTLFE